MIVDLKLEKNDSGRYDMSVSNGDLETVEGYDSAITVSLQTDVRADASQVPKPERRRGWAGDTVSLVVDRLMGSLIWLVNQSRLTQKTLNACVDFAQKSMAWLVEDELAIKVDVSGEIVPRSGIALDIVITAPDGSTESRHVPLWEATGSA